MSEDKKIVILVDLDKTLAEYTEWGDGEIGEPVPAMMERVKDWIQLGYEVRIFTARVAALFNAYQLHKGREDAVQQVDKIKDWLRLHLGRELEVTAVKDQDVTELWDDRAVRVEANTGVSELHTAHLYLSMANVAEGPLPSRVNALVDSYVSLYVKHQELEQRYKDAVKLVWTGKVKVASPEALKVFLTPEEVDDIHKQSNALHSAFDERTRGMETITPEDKAIVVGGQR